MEIAIWTVLVGLIVLLAAVVAIVGRRYALPDRCRRDRPNPRSASLAYTKLRD